MLFILIPSYEPDDRLLKLISDIASEYSSRYANIQMHAEAQMDEGILKQPVSCYRIIIVNDGSSAANDVIFEKAGRMGCTILKHDVNKGKGRALKTGFKFIMENIGGTGTDCTVVCADSDGQHTPSDIFKVAEKMTGNNRCIVIGSRILSGLVPFRSRFGNTITKYIFALATGVHIRDTQTGLRAYPADMLNWLCSVKGDRFEYEMIMLIEAADQKIPVYEEKIDTIYFSRHRSHFHTIIDSIKVYMPIIKFSASSIISALLDFIMLLALKKMTSSLLAAVVGARTISSLFNYVVNKTMVFSRNRRQSAAKSMPKYYMLAAVLLLINYLLMYLLYNIAGIPLILSKIVTEAILFVLSYRLQQKIIFPVNGRHSDNL